VHKNDETVSRTYNATVVVDTAWAFGGFKRLGTCMRMLNKSVGSGRSGLVRVPFLLPLSRLLRCATFACGVSSPATVPSGDVCSRNDCLDKFGASEESEESQRGGTVC